MSKFKVIDPAGFYFDKTKHEAGTEIELPAGPRLDAALHFKQVQAIKVAPPEAKEPKK